MDIRIRRAQEKDIPRIEELLTQVNMVHHNARPDLFNGPTQKYSAEELKKILPDDSRPVFAAVDENDVLEGYVFCIVQHPADTRLNVDHLTLYIDDLCVDEKVRGLHIGRRLYDYCVDYAKKNGFYNITLHVWNGNDSAAKFYESCGLTPQYTCLEHIL
ncbi:MAG: GNAT family N-acetyltransferase [Lachnospiraceae bacterium]|jgi:ribosomal protein S18 acetylase RimI-like enzyme